MDTLKLTNFELFDYLRHDDVHKDVDSWIEPPTDNFETFMGTRRRSRTWLLCYESFRHESRHVSNVGSRSSSWIKI